MKYKMVWDGPIVPYVRTTQRQKWCSKQWKRYAAFKDALRLWANTQGFPSLLGPFNYTLRIKIYVSGARRWDVDNAGKSASDSLFKQDKRISRLEVEAVERAGFDRMEIELEEGETHVAASRPSRARKAPPLGGGSNPVWAVG